NTKELSFGEKRQSIQAKFSVSGGFDGSDPMKRKRSFEGVLHGSANGKEFEIGMDARMTNNANYVKFDNISQLAPEYKKLEEEWMKFDLASLGALEDAASSDADEKMTGEKRQEISAQAKEKIVSLFKNAHLFTMTGRGKETIATGGAVYHYKLDVDKGGLAQFLDGLLAVAYEEGMDKKTPGITPPSQKEASESIKSTIDALQEMSGDIWIGTDDFLPYRSEITLTIQEPSGTLFHLLGWVR
ncbi:MAG: hypothetical protein G01um101448_933, partial [Parcubacteria group bacterium Gr01-1014_48]